MRRQAVEVDELFETANRLQAEGKEVTALTLLDALGGGSLRTIYKHLEAWKQAKPAVVIVGNEEMPESVRGIFAAAWRSATQEAGRQVLAVKEKAAEEVKEALHQFHGALEVIGKLEADADEAAQQADQVKAQLAEVQAECSEAKAEGAGLKATAEQLSKQVERLEEEQARLRVEAEKDRAGREAAATEAAELRGQLKSLQAQNRELLDKLSERPRNK
ncbi:MAG: DNA-binding protein [Candidatus Obscuribacterales bacterium]|jgi:DNA repair exonuclease SbcCD ATPase subunit